MTLPAGPVYSTWHEVIDTIFTYVVSLNPIFLFLFNKSLQTPHFFARKFLYASVRDGA